MVTLLAFNIKIEESILKYCIAKESYNVNVLDSNLSWCRYFLGDRRVPLQDGRFGSATSLRFASKWPPPFGLDIDS